MMADRWTVGLPKDGAYVPIRFRNKMIPCLTSESAEATANELNILLDKIDRRSRQWNNAHALKCDKCGGYNIMLSEGAATCTCEPVIAEQEAEHG